MTEMPTTPRDATSSHLPTTATDWVKNYYDQYWNRDSPPPQGDPLAQTRRNLLWQEVRRIGAAGRVLLDIGCGEGQLVADAALRGFSAIGIDVSEQAVERARAINPLCRFYAHPVEAQPWPVESHSVDIVTSFEVVEHLLQPRLLVRGANKVLRQGGYLALTTPYHGLIKNVALALFAFDRHFAVEGDHIRFFSDTALRRIVEENGFSVIKVIHYGRIRGLWAGSFLWARKLRPCP